VLVLHLINTAVEEADTSKARSMPYGISWPSHRFPIKFRPVFFVVDPSAAVPLFIS
jgi:hypothetical protein